MTKPKKAKKKVRGGPHPRAAYYADPGKLAVGSAVGAAIGALAGAAFVRNPNLFNDMMKQFGEMLVNPTLHDALRGLTTNAVAEEARRPRAAVAVHPPGGCGVEGCPTNNPHSFAEEEAKVSQENPSWTHTQVLSETAKRLEDQAERAHMAADPKPRRARSKKNSEPEETSN